MTMAGIETDKHGEYVRLWGVFKVPVHRFEAPPIEIIEDGAEPKPNPNEHWIERFSFFVALSQELMRDGEGINHETAHVYVEGHCGAVALLDAVRPLTKQELDCLSESVVE
jgi:hypothetical protein